MNITKRLSATSCLIVLMSLVQPAWSAEADQAASVTQGYEVPVLAIPHIEKSPTIDGRINGDEWSAASSVNALKAKRGAISNREAQYWLAWDDENLYIAMRSWLRPGERPITRIRGVRG